MIAFLSGTIRMAGLNHVVVDVGGVGYRVAVPLSLMATIPGAGEGIELYVYTQVREDAIQLYGFPALEDQDLFELLITVSGVGAKLALGVMSVLPTDTIAAAIAEGDAPALQRVPGVGAKTAQRIVLELKDKVTEAMWTKRATGASKTPTVDAVKDATEALIALGYPRAQAKSAAEQALETAAERTDAGSVVRAALQLLAKR